MFTIPSIGLATFLYAMITATALFIEIIRKIGFDQPLSWSLHDAMACTMLGVYCGYGLTRITEPRPRYILRRTLAISLPVLLGIGLTILTDWYLWIEFGMFGTLVLHSYQMKVAHARGYIVPGTWLY